MRRRTLIFMLAIVSYLAVCAQIVGGFQYDSNGHIIFIGYNTLGYDYEINVRVEPLRSNNGVRKNVYANQGIRIGPNSNFGNWYWQKGDLVVITYPNNQCAMWECPDTDKHFSGPTRILTPTKDYVFVTMSDGGRLGFFQIFLENNSRYIFFHDEYIEVPKNRNSFKIRNYTYYYTNA